LALAFVFFPATGFFSFFFLDSFSAFFLALLALEAAFFVFGLALVEGAGVGSALTLALALALALVALVAGFLVVGFLGAAFLDLVDLEVLEALDWGGGEGGWVSHYIALTSTLR
jgi:hypothetical protein